MKIIKLIALIAVYCSLITCLHAQGILTPPGAPAPTMKTLNQVEPRTPISSVPFTIGNSGSYYLTKNLNVTNGDAITITANQVTLDLDGFTISSTAPSATGTGILLVSGVTDISILNGHIKGAVTETSGIYSGSGFANGIAYSTSQPENVHVTAVSVSGCLNAGIDVGYQAFATLVESCAVRTVGGGGIFASGVSRCTASGCGGPGIVAKTASDCNAYSIGSNPGILADTAANCYGVNYGSSQGIRSGTAANCRGYSYSSQGISAETASNCFGESSLNRGLFANVAISCSGYSNGGSYGLFATSIANTCYGLSATGTGLNAAIAIGCIGANNSGTSVSYIYHYNMPP